MLTAWATVTAAAENAYLINEIAFFQNVILTACKYTNEAASAGMTKGLSVS
jgi:hypothetical protein